MNLKERIPDRPRPVTLFEVLPPERDVPETSDESVCGLAELGEKVDAINIPEIRNESGTD